MQETPEQHTQTVLYLLARKDENFPKIDFFLRLMNMIKNHLAEQVSLPNEVLDERALRIIQDLARSLATALEAENRWQELTESWLPRDVFNALSLELLNNIFYKK